MCLFGSSEENAQQQLAHYPKQAVSLHLHTPSLSLEQYGQTQNSILDSGGAAASAIAHNSLQSTKNTESYFRKAHPQCIVYARFVLWAQNHITNSLRWVTLFLSKRTTSYQPTNSVPDAPRSWRPTQENPGRRDYIIFSG